MPARRIESGGGRARRQGGLLRLLSQFPEFKGPFERRFLGPGWLPWVTIHGLAYPGCDEEGARQEVRGRGVLLRPAAWVASMRRREEARRGQ